MCRPGWERPVAGPPATDLAATGPAAARSATSGQHRGVDLGDRRDSRGGHHEVELGAEVLQHLTHTVGAGEGQAVDPRTADAHR